MTEPVRRGPPLPIAQTFLACGEIYSDQRTRSAILVGPTNHVPISQFPAHVRLSFFVELVGGHGSYQPRLVLRDDADEVVWGWGDPRPIEHQDPLFPQNVIFYDLMVAVPRVGRYQLEFHLNGEVAAQRTMWFGPTAAFRT